ncbi:MAG: 50S ribosomal protein L35 [Parcubacteria group bacterium]|nr:50S ribosomal protein L35 [Parcubacteria group bacterium]MBI2048949.1 50S ribosomal protein L35 [Parcubacteria group bacterium]
MANKSFTKRLKLTKNGKIITRKGGINHFNAKKSRSKQMERKRPGIMTLSNKDRGRFLS